MRGGRPSHTAAKIAKGVIYLGADPRIAPLLPAGAADLTERLLIGAGVLRSWERSLFRSAGLRRLMALIEWLTIPGQSAHLAIRKRFFDDGIRAAIEGGATQVLAVGAGFDTLCLRLAAAFPEVAFLEVDHPATQDAKRRGAEACGPLPRNLTFLPADLTEARLEDLLREAESWDPAARSAVEAEGVLMYLPEESVAEFLAVVRRNTGPGSRLIFDALRADEKGRPRLGRIGGLMRLSARLIGEPLEWAVRDGEMAGFLGDHGFRLDDPPERSDIHRRYLEPAGLEDLTFEPTEILSVAETGPMS